MNTNNRFVGLTHNYPSAHAETRLLTCIKNGQSPVDMVLPFCALQVSLATQPASRSCSLPIISIGGWIGERVVGREVSVEGFQRDRLSVPNFTFSAFVIMP